MRSLNQRMTYEQPPAATGDKIGMIEGSMRCYVCGLIGLVPVLGIPGSILALIWGARAARGAAAVEPRRSLPGARPRRRHCWPVVECPRPRRAAGGAGARSVPGILVWLVGVIGLGTGKLWVITGGGHQVHRKDF